MRKYAKYIKRAQEFKIITAKIIPAKSIVTAEWVRLKCQFGCDAFGKSLTCPPFSPAPEQTRRMLAQFKYALLIHSSKWTDIRQIVIALEREIFLDGYYKAFGMGAGPCNLCQRCARYCRHPDQARPSMEACGIDVFTTVKNNGLPIYVLNSRNCKANYYGVILIE